MFKFEVNDYDEITITGIEDQNVTEIEIPVKIDGNFVSNIGDWAFSGCSSLTKVTFPDNYIFIGNGAFSGCTSLREVKLPEICTIGRDAFRGCPYAEK